MSARKRIMLLEVSPLIPQPIVYATLDPASKSANVTLSGGDLTATAVPTNFGRARATIPMESGVHYWETTIVARPDSGYTASPGILVSTEPLTGGTFGFDAFLTAAAPYGLNSGASYIYWNSTLVVALGTLALGTVICNLYDADSGTYKIRINGGSWQTVFVKVASTSNIWYAGCSVSRNASYTFNFGASAFSYAVPSGARAGIYTQADPVATTFYFSSDAFNTTASDSVPSTEYKARIASSQDLQLSRRASCYAWTGKPQSSRGSLRLVNVDGALDAMEEYFWRDAVATIHSGYEGDPRSAFVLQSTELVDDAAFENSYVDIDFLDPLSSLDSAVPRYMYSSTNANSVTINTPYPKVFGNPQYCEGVPRTTATTGNDSLASDFTDSDDVVEIVTAYDRGDIFDHLPSGGNRDFWMTQDGTGMKLQNTPAGKVTCHPIGPNLYDATSTNYVTNANPFAGWSGSNPPTGWTLYGTAWTITNRFQDGSGFGGTAGSARMRVSGSQTVGMYNSATSVAAGRYVIELTVEVLTTAGYICFLLGTTYYFVRIDRVGKMRLAFNNPSTNQLVMMGGITGSYSIGAVDFVFSGLKMFSAAVPEYLPEWLSLFVETYGGRTLATSEVSTFVTDANWRLAHYSEKEETISSILQKTMDGWIGCLIPKRNGDVTVFGLKEPSDTPDYSFTSAQIKSVKSVPDKAPGLTTRIAGRRNYSVTPLEQIAGGATATVRAELQKEYIIIRSGQPSETRLGPGLTDSSSLVVAQQFRHADGSPPQETLLQESDHIQTQVNRVTTLFKDKKRRFYTVILVLDAAVGDLLEPGMTINITWNRNNLQSGKNLLLYGIRTGFWSNIVELDLWG